MEHPVEINREDPSPELVADVTDGRITADARAVDQCGNCPKLSFHLVEHAVYGRRVADVGDSGTRRPTRRLDVGDDRLRPLDLDVIDADVVKVLGQPTANRRADTLSATGHQSDLRAGQEIFWTRHDGPLRPKAMRIGDGRHSRTEPDHSGRYWRRRGRTWRLRRRPCIPPAGEWAHAGCLRPRIGRPEHKPRLLDWSPHV